MGRLAPTPSGHLHLGNTLAFAAAWLSVRSQGGRLLLRIEDVDTQRARPEVAEAQRADLRWLGLHWDEETPPQSTRDYRPWLEALTGTTYRCTCTRRQIREAGGIYPGTCRSMERQEGAVRLELPAGVVHFIDRRVGATEVDPNLLGDPVLRRRDGVFAYTLAVVADDIADGVTEVVRGADLLEHTAVQQRLYQALGATPPSTLHAPLVLGPDGRKLSKSTGSTELRALRATGWQPADVWRVVLPWLGSRADSLEGALPGFDPTAGSRGPVSAPVPDADT